MRLRDKHKRYYIPEEGERGWKWKYQEWFHSFKPVPSFPEDVQIQTITGCNASCVFCPSGKTNNRFASGKMEDNLYRKIIDESVRKPVKRISPYLMNEPLLDRELGWKIKYIAERKPAGLSIKLNSNASLLTGETAEEILTSGLERLNISFHGISKGVYEKSMQGLNYEKTLDNVNNFLVKKSEKKAKNPKVTITLLKTKLIEPEIDMIKTYWVGKEVSLHIRSLENRAKDFIENKGLNPIKWQAFERCKRLFTQAYILYNGDMVLCCADWERTTILGNVREKSIQEVWNSERAVSIRKKFLSGDKEGLPCHFCLKLAGNHADYHK